MRRLRRPPAARAHSPQRLPQVCNIALRGTFQNCGQNCIGLERMIVNKGVYDKMVERMAFKVWSLCSSVLSMFSGI